MSICFDFVDYLVKHFCQVLHPIYTSGYAKKHYAVTKCSYDQHNYQAWKTFFHSEKANVFL